MDEQRIYEIENENVNEVYDLEPVADQAEEKGSLGVVLGVGAAVTAAAIGAVVWFKTRDERRARREARKDEAARKRLEAQGFTVTKPYYDLESDIECVDEDDAE